MAEVSRLVHATPDQIFAVLADGWSYPLWVVGATHMRAVDPEWPAVGSRIHHSVGAWPVMLEDYTEVLDVDAGRRLELRARAWPSGEARVELDLQPVAGGTMVTMRENAMSGPGLLVPGILQDLGLYPRNVETLLRLSALAVRGGPGAGSPDRR